MLNLKEGEIYYSIEDLKGYEVVTYRSGYWYLCCFKVTCSAIKHIFDMTPQEEFSKKFFTSHLVLISRVFTLRFSTQTFVQWFC